MKREPTASRPEAEAARDLLRLGQQGPLPAARARDERLARGGAGRRVGQDPDHGQADCPGRGDVRRRRRAHRPTHSTSNCTAPPARSTSTCSACRETAPDLDCRREREPSRADSSGIDFMLDEPVRGADERLAGRADDRDAAACAARRDRGATRRSCTVDNLGLDVDAVRGLEALDDPTRSSPRSTRAAAPSKTRSRPGHDRRRRSRSTSTSTCSAPPRS